MLHHFFQNILKPLVRSKVVARLENWASVKEEFLDLSLYRVEEGPHCKLPDYMENFLSTLVRSDLEEMAATSVQPNVRMPKGYHMMDSDGSDSE
jgi:hypothetical protein